MRLLQSKKHSFLTLLVSIFISACATQLGTETATTLSLPNGLYGHAVINNGDKIYVLAGSQKGGFSRDIQIIDPHTQKVTRLENKLLPRRYHSAVWDGKDSIYILGGVSNWHRTTRLQPLIEVFDIPSGTVSIIGETPIPRRFASAVYIDGKIIVAGGSVFSRNASTHATNTVAIYDIKKNLWRKAANLPFAEDTRIVALGQHIYAIGGFNHLHASDHFSRYDIEADEWVSLPALPTALSAHSAVSHDNKIYTFGDYKDLSASFVYDLNTQRWKKSSFDFQASRHNAATILNDTIYVIGGTTSASGPFLHTVQTFSVNQH
ncbi:kelch repeat-containing protein [Paraglaciecola aquimarina]|uniref:Kelch repeat-containing protein n=1 Tax=Paraglaciecola aquimarina TaxID=1235557 RepID=A0ABU3SS07_9ALTE|nr:kelch repeat-containing protein [Paraglaciecola aquimarina]MDU0352762.1 kelch repeat-containing protein [Paraglaciecola aquimarina]